MLMANIQKCHQLILNNSSNATNGIHLHVNGIIVNVCYAWLNGVYTVSTHIRLLSSNIDGLMQRRLNSCALAMELLYCIKLSILCSNTSRVINIAIWQYSGGLPTHLIYCTGKWVHKIIKNWQTRVSLTNRRLADISLKRPNMGQQKCLLISIKITCGIWVLAQKWLDQFTLQVMLMEANYHALFHTNVWRNLLQHIQHHTAALDVEKVIY